MASKTKLQSALEGLENLALSKKVNNVLTKEYRLDTSVAAATTVAIVERPIFRAVGACRISGIEFISTASVTGTATDYFTLTVRKRTAASSFTATTAITTYAADTSTTDDAVAFVPKDLGWSSIYAATTASVFELADGDEVTAEVTKSSSTGMTYPISAVRITTEPRE